MAVLTFLTHQSTPSIYAFLSCQVTHQFILFYLLQVWSTSLHKRHFLIQVSPFCSCWVCAIQKVCLGGCILCVNRTVTMTETGRKYRYSNVAPSVCLTADPVSCSDVAACSQSHLQDPSMEQRMTHATMLPPALTSAQECLSNNLPQSSTRAKKAGKTSASLWLQWKWTKEPGSNSQENSCWNNSGNSALL